VAIGQGFRCGQFRFVSKVFRVADLAHSIERAESHRCGPVRTHSKTADVSWPWLRRRHPDSGFVL